MLRSMAKSLEAEVIQDPDYPYFRILDFWLREGGDNPDQRYAFSPIRGGEAYRVWGQAWLGGEDRTSDLLRPPVGGRWPLGGIFGL